MHKVLFLKRLDRERKRKRKKEKEGVAGGKATDIGNEEQGREFQKGRREDGIKGFGLVVLSQPSQIQFTRDVFHL